jgi:hypothetical protein
MRPRDEANIRRGGHGLSAQQQDPGRPEMGAQDTGEPTEEQLRAAYAAELSRITSADMILQAAASLLNIGAYRLGLLGPEDPAGADGGGGPRDMEQVRDAIDAVRGLLEVIERSRPQEVPPLRQALSQLQMAYAREAQVGAGAAAPGPAGEQPQDAGRAPGAPAAAPNEPTATPAAQPQQGSPTDPPGPGPAESSGRLWVPGR